MAKPFRLMVLTPEREFYNGDAVFLSVNTISGTIGVMADHMPLVTALDVGTLVIRPDENTVRTAFHSEGFIEIRSDGVYVLAQACEWPEEIDEKRAIEAEQRASKRIARHEDDYHTMPRTKVALMRALTRRKVKSLSNMNTK